MKFLDLKYEAFGLDINDLSLKIIKLKKKRKGFVLTSFNEIRMAPGIVEDGVIKDGPVLEKIMKSAYNSVRGRPLKTKYAVVSLPEEKSFLQVIQMPKMTEDELRVAVPLEAENYIPMPISDVHLDFQVVGPDKGSNSHLEVLIIAMPKKIVDSYVSCLKNAGFIPIALEAESEAIARALIKKDVKSPLMVLVDIGENNTNFIVFSGNSIRFTCSIPISSQSLTEAVSKSLQVSFSEAEKIKIEHGLDYNKNRKSVRRMENFTEAMTPILSGLTEQIKKYLNFYRDHSSYEYFPPDRSTERILLCGGGAKLKGLPEFISKDLGIPVEIGNPLVNLAVKKSKSVLGKDLIFFTTAMGLAQRQINKD